MAAPDDELRDDLNGDLTDDLNGDLNDVSPLDGDLRIGDFLVQPQLKQVVRLDDGRVLTEHSLPDKAMGVLVYLARHAGQICERDDILDAVWGEDRNAYDRVLDNAVAEVRRALEDDAREPTFVQTVPKRGYRFLQAPIPIPLPQEQDTAASNDATETHRRRSFRFLTPVLLLLGCIPLAWIVGANDGEITLRVDAPNDLFEQTREALLTDRSCLPSDQLRVTRRSFRPDLRIEIEEQRSDGPSLTSGRIQSGGTTLLATAHDVASDPLAMKRWQQDLRDAADQILCISGLLPDPESACLCLEAARPLVPGQRPARALPLLERAVDLDPKLAAAYDQLARVHALLGESEKAEAVLRRGLEEIQAVDSDSALILRRRLAHLLKDFDTEWRLLTELGRRFPDDPSWIVERAKHLNMYRGDCAGALELLSGLPRPLALAAGLELARAHLNCGQEDETIAVLTELVAKSPLEIEGRKWLVAALSTQQRFEEARSVASEVLALAPDDMESLMLKAWIANATGALTEAIGWARRARELAQWPTDHQRIDQLLTKLALNSGDYEGCLELTDSLASPSTPTAVPLGWLVEQHYLRSVCLLRLDDVEGAKAVLEELRAVQGTTDAYAQNRILALRGDIELRTIGEGGSIERGVEAFERATELAPFDGHIPYRAALTLEDLGRDDLAEGFYLRAHKANPQSPWLNCRLGLLYLRQGRSDEAFQLVSRAMKIFPEPQDSDLWRRCDQASRDLSVGGNESEE